ncbi:M55 family metallopeptidase [Athalassotoga saccharophila]|uniref:M55 family metallopeptidase n=1 Tax=Athalassotoga saccharophila TaxID=1441386 RepID=UPI00137A02E5|nr:M55 family metallopeptidase [Athalassotoga saccharophila]BBJ27854.1 D-aminopeptidase [Athalassotoga saccharophila]
MKIFISTDMEGLPGINSWHQVEEKDPRYLGKYMAETLTWIVDGIKSSDLNPKIEQILICDSHSKGENLSYDFTEKDDRIYLISGGLRDYYMMTGLDASFSTVFFVGYHAGVGSMKGTMDHTYSTDVYEIKINGKHMSESTINAAFAGNYDVPVSMIIGDHALVEELKVEMPQSVLIETKHGLSKFAAVMKPKNLLKREIIEGTKEALLRTFKMSVKPYKIIPPYKVEISFKSTAMADEAVLIPGVKRISGTTVTFKTDFYDELIQTLLAVVYAGEIGEGMGK